MGGCEDQGVLLAAKFEAILPHLDERQRRLLRGAEARSIGHGGIRLVARAAGVREATVSLGVSELDSGEPPLGRARRPGGGCKRVADLDPGLRDALLALVEPDVRGDPMSPLRWTTKSTRHLAAELTRQGHRVSADTVGDLLREEDFSLQANAKTVEGRQHPDRNAQSHYINEQAKAHQAGGGPRDQCGHQEEGSATRCCTRRVNALVRGPTTDVGSVAPGQCSRPVPTPACVAGNGSVRSSGEKPKGLRSIRRPQARGRPDG
jgi:Rhodopirellula transposase DDE domain